MSNIYGIVATKGGSGKSNLCVNLAAILADLGQRTLIIDFDGPQGTSSNHYQVPQRADHGLTRMIKTASPDGCISQTSIPNLDIVISDDPKWDRGGIILPFLQESAAHILFLGAALNALEADYDYILIDTVGTKNLSVEAVIYAADLILTPVVTNYVDAKAFVADTVGMFERLMPKPGMPSITGRPLPKMAAILNRMNHTVDAKKISSWLRQRFDNEIEGQVSILNTCIPDMTAYNKAAGIQMPAHRYEVKRRPDSPTKSAHDTFLALVCELSPKFIGSTPSWDQ